MTGAARAGGFDRIATLAASRAGIVLVGAWAFGEAIILPIVPDVALVLLALAAPRRLAALFAALLVGAIAGSLVLAAMTTAAPAAVDTMIGALPGIDDGTIATVDAELEGAGVAGFAQFGPGPPLKVYTTEWVNDGGGTAELVLGVALNRLTRIGPIVLVAAVVGWLASGWLRRHERAVIAGYAIAWAAFYAFYWVSA